MRHKPRLIEPSPVVIEQKDTGSTEYDELTREPIKQVSRLSEVCCSAQVSWGRSFDRSFAAGGQGGPTNDAAGYLVFEISELTEKCIVLKAGDRVKTIGGIASDVYLKRTTYAGHHKGRPWLVLWDFQDYAPQKEASG